MLMVIINNVKCAKGQKVIMSKFKKVHSRIDPLKNLCYSELVSWRMSVLWRTNETKKVRVLVLPFLWKNEQLNDISDFYTLFNKIDITNMAC